MEATTAPGEPGLSARGEQVVHLSAHVERTELAMLLQQAEADGLSVSDVLRRSIRVGAEVWEAHERGGQVLVAEGEETGVLPLPLLEELPGRSLRG